MKKINKSRRGFSLVELMVVVAIMGTLAAIAIPAYNEYRKSAKKTAYRTDLLSLHKGWLAFGVELDSFCERDTNPENATIGNVGMESLLSSNLYGPGSSASLVRCTGTCVGVPGTSSGPGLHNSTAPACASPCVQTAVNGTGPGKDNYIGFGSTGCTNTLTSVVSNISVRGDSGGTRTPLETRCVLNTTTYTMGVGGHVSGTDYIGINVNNDGVVEEQEEDVRADVFNPGNANGICA